MIRLVWVTVVALQILLNDTYKLNHCKEMGAEPGRRFLIQPAAKLEPVIVFISECHCPASVRHELIHQDI